jgi:hypothetical protein
LLGSIARPADSAIAVNRMRLFITLLPSSGIYETDVLAARATLTSYPPAGLLDSDDEQREPSN